jgi:septal ring factor EnvC (AmiA/AmiB activator)
VKPLATLTLLLALACTGAAAAQERPEAAPSDRRSQEREANEKLETIREEIKALTRTQRELEGERSDAAKALREADEAINAGAKALRDIDAELVAQQAELERLEAQKAALETRLTAQRDALAQLLRSAYALGRHEQLKLLLAQDRVDELARVLAYHRYFQRDRSARIETLLVELRELAELGRAVQAQRETLAASRSAQEQRIAELETQREQRRTLLSQLDAQFADAKARLTALGRDERALLQLLTSLRDVFADIPKQVDEAKPFAQRRGGLRRPLAGKVVSAFGGRLPDGRSSQGWLIAGETGANVGAVAPGRVAFADWLKGYGLIVILDHGDGYMSLYAQNDSLLKEVGDWVAPGEALAGVGSSGGHSDPALYFELRLNGRPVDPKAWFAPQ